MNNWTYILLCTFLFLMLFLAGTAMAAVPCPDVHMYGSGTVTFTDDVYLNETGTACLTALGDDATVDCAGYSIIGDNSTGSMAITSNYSATQVLNCNIRDFETGILLNGSNNSAISSVTINQSTYGIHFISTNYSNISNSNIDVIDTAVSLDDNGYSGGGSLFNNVWGNTLTAQGSSIYLSVSASDSIIWNNTLFSPSGIELFVKDDGNTFYWNNFTDTAGLYVQDDSGGLNFFNTSLFNGTDWVGEGNLWGDIGGSDIISDPQTLSSYGAGWLIGNSGADYPYGDMGSGYGNTIGVADYAPLLFSPSILQNCSCGADLSTPNFVCNVTENQNYSGMGADCFDVAAENVTIECNGNYITGDDGGAYGIFSDQVNTAINDCNILTGFQEGVGFVGSDGGIINNTNATTDIDNAFYLLSATGAQIMNSNGTATGGGNIGAWVENSANNSIISSFMEGSTGGAGDGVVFLRGKNNSIISSTIIGVQGDAGVFIREENGSSVVGSNITSYTGIPAIWLWSCLNSTIDTSNATSDTGYGIYAHDGGNNNITNSTGYTTGVGGIYLSGETGDIISNSNGVADGYGINIASSTNISVIDSNATSNYYGITSDYGSDNSIIGCIANSGIYTFEAIYSDRLSIINSIGTSTGDNALLLHLSDAPKIANSTFIGTTEAYNAVAVQSITNGVFANNTFISTSGILGAQSLLFVDAFSTNNLFYWNNFTDNGAGNYVTDSSSGLNFYNTTIAGQGEGNIWANVGSLDITSIPQTLSGYDNYGGAWWIGNNGTAHPYNDANNGGKTSGVSDEAPLLQNPSFIPCNVHDCQALDQPNTYYKMCNDVNISGGLDCFPINDSNITLDCDGHSITGSDAGGSGIITTYPGYSYFGQTFIRNCSITGSFYYGVYLQNTYTGLPSEITDTNASGLSYGIITTGSDPISITNSIMTSPNIGLSLTGSVSNTVSHSIISTNCSTCSALNMDGARTSTISNSKINGEVLIAGAYSNTLINNTIDGQGGMIGCPSGYADAIDVIYGSNYNQFINNTISNATDNLVLVDSSPSHDSLFLWNNFTDTARLYVNDTSGGLSFYNATTPFGKNEGNLWANVMDDTVHITGSVASDYGGGLFIGDSDTYSDANSLGKTSGVIDYAPLTLENETPIHYNGTITIFKFVVNGTLSTSDFFININTDNFTDVFAGDNTTGTSYNLPSGTLVNVTEDPYENYSTSYSGDCIDASIIENDTIYCNITNTFNGTTPPPSCSSTIVTSFISPSPTAHTTDMLLGYCQQSNTNSENMTIDHKWYKNGALMYSGSTSNAPSGSTVLVGSIGSIDLSVGDNWTLSCQATAGDCDPSNWLNSTPTEIVASPPEVGMITVYKQVVGGSLTAGDFIIHVNLTGGMINITGNPSGVMLTGVAVGNYTIWEAPYANYTTTYSTNCQPIEVLNDTMSNCTVTNTYSPYVPGITNLTCTITGPDTIRNDTIKFYNATCYNATNASQILPCIGLNWTATNGTLGSNTTPDGSNPANNSINATGWDASTNNVLNAFNTSMEGLNCTYIYNITEATPVNCSINYSAFSPPTGATIIESTPKFNFTQIFNAYVSDPSAFDNYECDFYSVPDLNPIDGELQLVYSNMSVRNLMISAPGSYIVQCHVKAGICMASTEPRQYTFTYQDTTCTGDNTIFASILALVVLAAGFAYLHSKSLNQVWRSVWLALMFVMILAAIMGMQIQANADADTQTSGIMTALFTVIFWIFMIIMLVFAFNMVIGFIRIIQEAVNGKKKI